MVASSYFKDKRLRPGKRKMAFPKYPMAMGWSQKEKKTIKTDLDLLVPECFCVRVCVSFPIEISPKHVRTHMPANASIPTGGMNSY